MKLYSQAHTHPSVNSISLFILLSDSPYLSFPHSFNFFLYLIPFSFLLSLSLSFSLILSLLNPISLIFPSLSISLILFFSFSLSLFHTVSLSLLSIYLPLLFFTLFLSHCLSFSLLPSHFLSPPSLCLTSYSFLSFDPLLPLSLIVSLYFTPSLTSSFCDPSLYLQPFSFLHIYLSLPKSIYLSISFSLPPLSLFLLSSRSPVLLSLTPTLLPPPLISSLFLFWHMNSSKCTINTYFLIIFPLCQDLSFFSSFENSWQKFCIYSNFKSVKFFNKSLKRRNLYN